MELNNKETAWQAGRSCNKGKGRELKIKEIQEV